jgi:uncharacterized delta-60 repeat protein
MTQFVSVLVVAGALVLADAPALAAPSDLDPAFSGDGKTTTSFGRGNNESPAVAIQPDGKLVVAGSIVGPVPAAFVGRYTSDGTLDPTFGGDGKVRMRDGKGGVCQAYAVALQPDGKILVAGEDYGEVKGRRWWRWALFRYRPNGSLDPSFGGDGRVFTDVTSGRDFANALVVRPNGKIVVAGTGHRRRFALVRYNPNGTLDRTFGADGTAFANVLPGHGREGARDLAVQADGKFVAAGESSALPSTIGQRAAIVRFTSSGSLDDTFGSGGWVTSDVLSFAIGVAIDEDGYIVTAGEADGELTLTRHGPDGAPDASFDGDGMVATPGLTGGFDVVVQPDRKIITTGKAVLPDSSLEPGFAVARYDVDGSPDPTFGDSGTVLTEFGAKNAWPTGLGLQADGKIVAVGYAGRPSVFSSVAIARYLGG